MTKTEFHIIKKPRLRHSSTAAKYISCMTCMHINNLGPPLLKHTQFFIPNISHTAAMSALVFVCAIDTSGAKSESKIN